MPTFADRHHNMMMTFSVMLDTIRTMAGVSKKGCLNHPKLYI